MKIVILDGTHNKNGRTLALVKSFIEGVKSVTKAEVKTFDLLNENIEFCKGCNKCTTDKDPVNVTCEISDDCQKIKEEALKADIVVFATPIYEYAVSSVMKRFLERCLTLVTFRFGPAPRAKPIKGRYGIILCTSGAPPPLNYLMGMTRYPKFILRLAAKLFRCGKIKSIYDGGNINYEKAKKPGVKVAKSFQN
ncbi:MAG: flavodoxin family protein [Candidatus Nanoarchaeia archaeon]